MKSEILKSHTKNNHGNTFINLILTLSVIGILSNVFVPDFKNWMEKYKVERQMTEMYFDLMNVRVRAMQTGRAHFMTLTETQYEIREDIAPWPDGDGLITEEDDIRPSGHEGPIPLIRKNLDPNESITWTGLSGPQPQIKFSEIGLASSDGNTDFAICRNTNIDADYNCISISGARIELKKIPVETTLPSGGSIRSSKYDLQ